jgi:nicotinamidase-related amidase
VGDVYTTPHPRSAALILIDVQRDFYEDDAPALIEGTREAIPAMAELAAAFRDKGLPIVHTVRLYLADGSNVDLVRRHAIRNGARVVEPGSPGSQLAPQLVPGEVELRHELLLQGQFQQLGPREHILYKSRWGAFYETGLEAHLRNTGVDTVVVAGCNFPNCPRASIFQASERDFRVVLVTDAVSGGYDMGLAECRRIGVSVWNVVEVVKWLDDE